MCHLVTEQRRHVALIPIHTFTWNLNNLTLLHVSQAFAGGPLVQARNFAVMTGTNAGISCVMKRIRGVEDMQGR